MVVCVSECTNSRVCVRECTSVYKASNPSQGVVVVVSSLDRSEAAASGAFRGALISGQDGVLILTHLIISSNLMTPEIEP